MTFTRWTARLVGCAALLVLLGCVGEDGSGSVNLDVDGGALIAAGEIGSQSQEVFADLIEDQPGIDRLVLRNIGGSVDDEANLVLARQVREWGLETVVPSDGLVASGGTDLFLAGTERILEDGACVGVHAWATDAYTAKDIPRDDPEHADYLRYFQQMGIDPEFYWFTLDAAPAEDMHWMTAAEARRFGMATNAVTRLGTRAECDAR